MTLDQLVIGRAEDCWLWQGARDSKGYGHFGLGGRTLRVHRFVYELVHGAVPDGHDLDHLCRVRHCANPAHLEPVTRRENLRRGHTFVAANLAKSHCPRCGGAYTVRPSGARRCEPCYRAARRRGWANG